jgi:hypothetical protein
MLKGSIDPTAHLSLHPHTHTHTHTQHNNSARACLGIGPPAAAGAIPPPDNTPASPLLLLSLRACIAREDWAGVASLLLPEGQGDGE